jgi:hypothetical protein
VSELSPTAREIHVLETLLNEYEKLAEKEQDTEVQRKSSLLIEAIKGGCLNLSTRRGELNPEECRILDMGMRCADIQVQPLMMMSPEPPDKK